MPVFSHFFIWLFLAMMYPPHLTIMSPLQITIIITPHMKKKKNPLYMLTISPISYVPLCEVVSSAVDYQSSQLIMHGPEKAPKLHELCFFV